MPNDYSVTVHCCLRSSLFTVTHFTSLLEFSSVHIDKVLAWLVFRKIYVLKASFSKNLLQITDINFLPTILELAQWILRRISFYEVKSWTECSTRRFVLSFRCFVVSLSSLRCFIPSSRPPIFLISPFPRIASLLRPVVSSPRCRRFLVSICH